MFKCNLTLLYAEDDNTEREMLLRKIKPLFKHVFVAKDGSEAYELFKKENPDMVLTDYQMPGITGLELIEKIKKLNEDINIIMFTGYTDSEYIIEAIKLKVNSYIHKPVLFEELLVTLEKNAKEILEKKEKESILNLLEEYKKTVDISSIVSIADTKGIIKYVNKQFEDISGYTKEELIGQPHSIIRHPHMPSSVFKNLWRTIKEEKKPWSGIIKNKKKNGNPYYVDSVIKPILDTDGKIIEFIAIRRDITEIMSPKKQLIGNIRSMENPALILVKIYNYSILREFYPEKIRKKFEKIFSSHLLELASEHMDINKIYLLNDGLFGIIKEKESTEEEIINKLKIISKKIELEDMQFEGNKYEIDAVFSFAFKGTHQFEDASIGIERIKTKNEIINATNLYKISKDEAKEKLETLNLIKEALKQEDKIVSYYQPIIDNKTKEVVKYESLIRLITNDEEVLSPYFFIDLSKKTGYYEELTYKVIQNANKVLNLDKNIKISINLSSSDIEDSQVRLLLIDLVAKKENEGRITFELLEDEEVKDISLISDFISLTKQIGDVKISIDDFGSGYSNYGRLSLFQPDYIKIDGSLIKDITTNKYNESVVKSLVVFSKENNIKTIAEFVSDEEIYKKVKELDIDYSQGYFFGKPEPIIL